MEKGGWGGRGGLGEGSPSLKCVTDTYNEETWHSLNLPKEDKKTQIT